MPLFPDRPFIENVAASDIEVGNFKDPGSNSLLIQISDPGSWKPTPKHKFAEILKFEFLDLDDADLRAYPALEDCVFKVSQAKDILSALVEAKLKNRNVIVHCYVGVSRSGAVVEFAKQLGFSDVGNYRAPNKRVFDMLSVEYRELLQAQTERIECDASARILLKHCPFCGHLPHPDNYRDSIHPVVKDGTVWKAGCLATEGGCDASILGWTRDEAILNWNRRVTENVEEV